jgi:hypothetical protein
VGVPVKLPAESYPSMPVPGDFEPNKGPDIVMIMGRSKNFFLLLLDDLLSSKRQFFHFTCGLVAFN